MGRKDGVGVKRRGRGLEEVKNDPSLPLWKAVKLYRNGGCLKKDPIPSAALLGNVINMNCPTDPWKLLVPANCSGLSLLTLERSFSTLPSG